MDMLLLVGIVVLAIGALVWWAYRYFLYRPVTVVEAVPDGTSRFIHLIGLIGLILLAVFIVLLATGWRFGVEIIRPQ
jgi:hypothetical protein